MPVESQRYQHNPRTPETRLETTVLFEEWALPGTEHVGVGAARMPGRRGTAYFLAGQSSKFIFSRISHSLQLRHVKRRLPKRRSQPHLRTAFFCKKASILDHALLVPAHASTGAKTLFDSRSGDKSGRRFKISARHLSFNCYFWKVVVGVMAASG